MLLAVAVLIATETIRTQARWSPPKLRWSPPSNGLDIGDLGFSKTLEEVQQ
ncbi:hypothetical protein BVRB_6g152580 [Beta vulgaris subsp. vulgaris]|nr:hypothetical protein BVRB_6g152580 [Beta vulgaris subsp. vulgaris]